MAQFRRGQIWWYKFYFAGQEIRESSKSTSKTVAKGAEQQRRRELEAGFHNLKEVRQQRIRCLKDIIAEYLVGYRLRYRSASFADYALGHVSRLLGTVLAVDIDEAAVLGYTYAIGSHIVVPAGARVYGQLQQADQSGLVSVKFDEIELLDGQREQIDAAGTGLDLGPIKGDVYGKNTGKNILVRALSGIGAVTAELAGNNNNAAFSEDDMIRQRLAENIGTTGDSEIMNLSANSRIVVSVPADTKIYVVFTKHPDSPAGFHKVSATTP